MSFPAAVQSMGRFQVLNENQLIAPGKCAGCGGVTNRHFIDFGLELDFYGVVYLCLETCFTEVANQIGFISPEQAESLKKQILVGNEANAVLLTQLGALENVRDAIAGYSSVDPSVAADRGDSGPVHSGSGDQGTQTEGHSDPGSSVGQSITPGSEQGSPESPDVDGSANVRHDDSLEQFAKEFDI